MFQAFDRLICRFVDGRAGRCWLDDVRSLIDANLEQPLSLAEIGGRVGRHPNYICEAFRARFGVTISKYVRRQRLLFASAELLATGCTATQAAYRAGFADAAHFARSHKAASDHSAMGVRNSRSIAREVSLPED
jgi:AraC-like DNA-binding protein